MRLVSWNLNARVRAIPHQIGAIRGLAPDVVALQEVTAASWASLEPALHQTGLGHTLLGTDTTPTKASSRFPRFVAIASRWPVSRGAGGPGRTPEIVLCAEVLRPGASFEIIGVHIPLATREPPLKVEVQEAVAAHVAASCHNPLILCGDFNSPMAETADGTIVPFAAKRGDRAREAELAITYGVPKSGMKDAFRLVHGYGRSDFSWRVPQKSSDNAYRLDHVFVSQGFTVIACWYAHELTVGNSDHSPIVADLF